MVVGGCGGGLLDCLSNTLLLCIVDLTLMERIYSWYIHFFAWIAIIVNYSFTWIWKGQECWCCCCWIVNWSCVSVYAALVSGKFVVLRSSVVRRKNTEKCFLRDHSGLLTGFFINEFSPHAASRLDLPCFQKWDKDIHSYYLFIYMCNFVLLCVVGEIPFQPSLLVRSLYNCM